MQGVREKIEQLAQKRILILDGAMGSLISSLRPEYKGCKDILCQSDPDLIYGIHEEYLKAGADIIETNSMNSTAVSLRDYGHADFAYELSFSAASLARKAADSFSTPDKPRFVAGSIGPTSKSLSISHDINDPGKRAIGWDELEAAYYDNARGLLDGGADLIMIETFFDTLNAKAAIFAVRRLSEESGIDVPLIVSATVSEGGKLLSGQTVEAFCVSVQHAAPIALGLNCSFGAEKLKPHIEVMSAAAPCLVSAYPNAGLPNSQGLYDQSPEVMADQIEEYLCKGIVNIVGGCCGSTPAHIAAIAARAENYKPRSVPGHPQKTKLAGLEVMELKHERINLAENAGFLSFVKKGEYENAVDITREMIEAAPALPALIDVCIPDASPEIMSAFLSFALQYPDLARLPIMISSSRWDVIEAGLKCLQGKGMVNFTGLEEGNEEYLHYLNLVNSYGAVLFDPKKTENI